MRTPSTPSTPRTPRTPRTAARLAVLDPDGSVFLFRYPAGEIPAYWAMPGGGLEPGESALEGVVREVEEETGWTDLVPGPLLCTWEHDFTRKGVPVRQSERIYVAYGPRREPTPQAVARHGEDDIVGWRWWSPAELAAATEDLWPPQLPQLVAALPAEPARLEPTHLEPVRLD
ncbi:NUDIX domain-containing protein [Streptomyces sp. NPDC051940]|uniref:NUDIX domain-containing protein n=1 Tax=Streptomyces sp. NPDC051940 TaxID=3155675 RepID=UPI00344808D1